MELKLNNMNEFIQEKMKAFEEVSKILFTKNGIAVLLDYPPHEQVLDEQFTADWIRTALTEAYNRGVQDSIKALKEKYGSDGKPALVIIESFDGFNEQRPALEETLDNLNNLIK